MKSSTVKRSNLSQESMDVIENLANDNSLYEQYVESDELPEEYLRQDSQVKNNKSKEIDLLWQSFKNTQLNSQSPVMLVILGFIMGVVTTLLFMWAIGAVSNFDIKLPASPSVQSEEKNIETQAQTGEEVSAEAVQDENQDVVSDGETSEMQSVPFDSSRMTKYIIQDGDTVEKIIIKHYGSYTPQRAENIKKANNLSNLDRISIGQELLIPVEE